MTNDEDKDHNNDDDEDKDHDSDDECNKAGRAASYVQTCATHN